MRLQLRPGMRQVSVDITGRNSSDKLTLYASRTVPRPSADEHSWSAHTAVGQPSVEPLVVDLTGDVLASDTLYVSMRGIGEQGAMEFLIRWR